MNAAFTLLKNHQTIIAHVLVLEVVIGLSVLYLCSAYLGGRKEHGVSFHKAGNFEGSEAWTQEVSAPSAKSLVGRVESDHRCSAGLVV